MLKTTLPSFINLTNNYVTLKTKRKLCDGEGVGLICFFLFLPSICFLTSWCMYNLGRESMILCGVGARGWVQLL